MENNLFEQIPTKQQNPSRQGWYNTDNGELFWFEQEKEWSCRDEKISNEYPKFWYKHTNELIYCANELLTQTSDLYDFCIDRKYLDLEDIVDGQQQLLDAMDNMRTAIKNSTPDNYRKNTKN